MEGKEKRPIEIVEAEFDSLLKEFDSILKSLKETAVSPIHFKTLAQDWSNFIGEVKQYLNPNKAKAERDFTLKRILGFLSYSNHPQQLKKTGDAIVKLSQEVVAFKLATSNLQQKLQGMILSISQLSKS